jgi:hypothetical protein
MTACNLSAQKIGRPGKTFMRIIILVGRLVLDIHQLLMDLNGLGSLRKLASELLRLVGLIYY